MKVQDDFFKYNVLMFETVLESNRVVLEQTTPSCLLTSHVVLHLLQHLRWNFKTFDFIKIKTFNVSVRIHTKSVKS